MAASNMVAATGKTWLGVFDTTSIRVPLSLALTTAIGTAALVGWLSPAPSIAGPARPAGLHGQDLGDPPAAAVSEPEYVVKLVAVAVAGETLEEMLGRVGVELSDAARAARLVDASASPPPPGTAISLFLGDSRSKAGRGLAGISYRPRIDLIVEVLRDRAGRLRLATRQIAVDATPRRFRGRAGDNLYWSMRAAGVPPEVARDYLDILSDRLGPNWAAHPDDRFDLVVDHRLAATGETIAGPILYVSLDQASAPPIRLVRWTVSGREDFYEPGKSRQLSEGLQRPVPGPVSSRFGRRVHPVLGFSRPHRGVDFRAFWGSPVRAAADGTVAAAGWRGGYGRQIRLLHGGGLETSYSHLSASAVTAGIRVKKGQIIGYVGSSGLSTGPHLHYEVSKNGKAVDPLGLRHVETVIVGNTDLAAIRSRLDQLRSI